MTKYKSIEDRNRQRKKYYDKSKVNAPLERRKYNLPELKVIIKHEMTDMEISRMIHRTVQAIQLARHKYKNAEFTKEWKNENN